MLIYWLVEVFLQIKQKIHVLTIDFPIKVLRKYLTPILKERVLTTIKF